jgi:hypothetical protein
MGKYNEDELKRLIFDEKLPYNEIGKKYNVTGAAIKKAALRFGFSLEKRRKINETETFNKGKILIKYDESNCLNCGKSFVVYRSKKNKYCSNKCHHEKKHKELYEKFLLGDEIFQRANYNCYIFKSDILEEQKNLCLICGNKNEWNGKKIVFILDHIDGDASNNKRENLRLVCPNCDSQLDTYKSKNKNSTRVTRYKK